MNTPNIVCCPQSFEITEIEFNYSIQMATEFNQKIGAAGKRIGLEAIKNLEKMQNDGA